jgi:hypothetical protein
MMNVSAIENLLQRVLAELLLVKIRGDVSDDRAWSVPVNTCGPAFGGRLCPTFIPEQSSAARLAVCSGENSR